MMLSVTRLVLQRLFDGIGKDVTGSGYCPVSRYCPGGTEEDHYIIESQGLVHHGRSEVLLWSKRSYSAHYH